MQTELALTLVLMTGASHPIESEVNIADSSALTSTFRVLVCKPTAAGLKSLAIATDNFSKPNSLARFGEAFMRLRLIHELTTDCVM